MNSPTTITENLTTEIAPSALENIEIDLGDVKVNPKHDLPLRPLLIPIPGTANDFQFSIDNSSLERFTSCSRSAEYYIVNRREASTPAPALAFGKAIHSALELKYKYELTPAVKQRQLEIVTQAFQDNPVPVDDHRTLDRAMDVVSKYDKKYPVELFEIAEHPLTKEPCVEMKFELKLGKVEVNDWVPVWPTLDLKDPNLQLATNQCGNSEMFELGKAGPKLERDEITHVYIGTVYVLWTGRIDLIVRMDGLLWIMDHKTTQMMGPQFFEDFVLSNQTVGYAWAGQQIIQEPIAGFVLNALCVRKPTKTGTATEFERRRFLYEQEQLDEWHENTLVLVSDFLHHLARGYFPMETKWCFGKYGRCQYHSVCTQPKKDRELALGSSDFRNVTWSPLND